MCSFASTPQGHGTLARDRVQFETLPRWRTRPSSKNLHLMIINRYAEQTKLHTDTTG